MARTSFLLAATFAVSAVVAGCGDLAHEDNLAEQTKPAGDAGASKDAASASADAAPAVDVPQVAPQVAQKPCIVLEDCASSSSCERPMICHSSAPGAQGFCELTQLSFPTGSCDDGDACTQGDQCFGGVCKSGVGKKCDDANQCTSDSCDKQKGCVVTNTDGVVCDDNNACTKNESCKSGACAASGGSSCDDGNPCTTDSCDKAKGCVNTPNVNPCDDGDKCSTAEACKDGLCLGGKPVDCDDKNICTTDACDSAKGCINTATGSGPCDDSNNGTENDVCGASGECVGTPLKCAVSADCQALAKDVCLGFVCVKGQCMLDSATTKQVGDKNICTEDACDPKSGVVSYKPLSGGACDDGEVCTVGDSCVAGSCKGTLDSCDDGNPCTMDACVKGKGCIHTLDPCSDNDKFTTDACDPAKGCTHEAVFVSANCKMPASYVTPEKAQFGLYCLAALTIGETTQKGTKAAQGAVKLLAKDFCAKTAAAQPTISVVVCNDNVDGTCDDWIGGEFAELVDPLSGKASLEKGKTKTGGAWDYVPKSTLSICK